ncbi:MAG: hypothetical protein H6981_14565 [Gammaproteobacteria bacterium]|nr:hypothetical protein [Gammaproteobacteria bacterium]MCP5138007.1 hypothetical protein [Gammaproteobacteria bacterium]
MINLFVARLTVMLIAFTVCTSVHATATGAYGSDCQSCHVNASGGSPWNECGKDFYCAARSTLGGNRDFDEDADFTSEVLETLKTDAGISGGSCSSTSSSTYANLTSDLCSGTGTGDTGNGDGSNDCAFDRGRITYQNTIKKIIDAHCVSCHAPRLDDTDLGDGYAVEPADLLRLHNWSSLSSESTRANIVNYTVHGGLMPPSESELPLSDDELDDLQAWETQGYPRGSNIGRIEILDVTDATRTHFSIHYQASDDQALWEALTPVAASAARAVRPFVLGDDPNAHVAIFKTTSHEGFDPSNDTLIKDCLALGDVALGFTIPSTPTSGVAVPMTGYSLYACVYDTDNVFCDRWPERLNNLIRLP